MARRIPGIHRCVDGRYDDDELASRLPGGTRTGDRYCTGRAGPGVGRDCLQGSGTHGFGRGGDSLEVFRLTRSGTEKSEFGGEGYHIDIFTIVPDTEFGSDPSVDVPESVRVDDAERYLDQADTIPDTTAPVFQLYSDTGGKVPFEYFCSRCGSTDVSADGIERIVFDECRTQHNAEEWKEAFL